MIFGTMLAAGTEDFKIYFTSVNDNSKGVILPQSTGNPKSGTWKSVNKHGGWNGVGNITVNHAVFRYGGDTNNDGDAGGNIVFKQYVTGSNPMIKTQYLPAFAF